MNPGIIALIVILGIVLFLALIIIIWWISKSNSFKRMKIKIEEAASSIDVALTKRYDLLTKQFNIVKGYNKHEAETLENIISLREGIQTKKGDGSIDMKAASLAASSMTQMQKDLNVVIERYPELKANTMFIGLQNSCTEVEEQLQASRRLYNSNVSTYNQSIVSFPGSLVANAMHISKEEFFEAEESKREDVKMEF